MNTPISMRNYREGDEAEIVRIIYPNASPAEIDSALGIWRHMYAENTFTDRSLIHVAQIDGTIVGCYHLLTRDVRLKPVDSCKAVLSGDMAVKPEFQGRGIGAMLSRSVILELGGSKGIELIYGFGSLKSHGFWERMGYKRLKLTQKFYTKTLRLSAYRTQLEQAVVLLGKIGRPTSISITVGTDTISATTPKSTTSKPTNHISVSTLRIENLGGFAQFSYAIVRGAAQLHITFRGILCILLLSVRILLIRLE